MEYPKLRCVFVSPCGADDQAMSRELAEPWKRHQTLGKSSREWESLRLAQGEEERGAQQGMFSGEESP